MTPYPTISEVHRIAKKYRLRRCIVLFESEDGTTGYASYGQPEQRGNHTRKIARLLSDDFTAECTARPGG